MYELRESELHPAVLRLGSILVVAVSPEQLLRYEHRPRSEYYENPDILHPDDCAECWTEWPCIYARALDEAYQRGKEETT